MSEFTLSTGEAVQHVLEGRECESEEGCRMELRYSEPRIFVGRTHLALNAEHSKLHWRLVPKLVKREEALRALATGKTIMRGGRSYKSSPSGALGIKGGDLIPSVDFAADFLDNTACWEIRP